MKHTKILTCAQCSGSGRANCPTCQGAGELEYHEGRLTPYFRPDDYMTRRIHATTMEEKSLKQSRRFGHQRGY